MRACACVRAGASVRARVRACAGLCVRMRTTTRSDAAEQICGTSYLQRRARGPHEAAPTRTQPCARHAQNGQNRTPAHMLTLPRTHARSRARRHRAARRRRRTARRSRASRRPWRSFGSRPVAICAAHVPSSAHVPCSRAVRSSQGTPRIAQCPRYTPDQRTPHCCPVYPSIHLSIHAAIRAGVPQRTLRK